MLAYALELNITICRIAYSIWLGARRITRIGLKIMGLTWAVRGAHIGRGFEGKLGCTWALAFGLYPP